MHVSGLDDRDESLVLEITAQSVVILGHHIEGQPYEVLRVSCPACGGILSTIPPPAGDLRLLVEACASHKCGDDCRPDPRPESVKGVDD